MKEINLEFGLPTSDAAVMKLKNEIITERKKGTKRIKVIHGYGSSGKGGVIKNATIAALKGLVATGTIRMFCPGEDFGPFSERGRLIAAKYPDVKGDRDWARQNDGVTIVVL